MECDKPRANTKRFAFKTLRRARATLSFATPLSGITPAPLLSNNGFSVVKFIVFVHYRLQWGNIQSVNIRWRAEIWQNSSENLFIVFKVLRFMDDWCFLWQRSGMASNENLSGCLAKGLDRHRTDKSFHWCTYTQTLGAHPLELFAHSTSCDKACVHFQYNNCLFNFALYQDTNFYVHVCQQTLYTYT